MKRTVIISNGHGGMINGIYQTLGKRSPDWENGILYEGMFNRWVSNRLIEKLDRANIPYFHISPELGDISLPEKVKRANTIHNKFGDVYILEIHANAGRGEGIEGFTSIGDTDSDKIADIFLSNLEKELPCQKMRYDFSDGDRDKESNFYILHKSTPPAFLLECGFMDNRSDYKRLWDEGYLEKIVNSLFKSVKELYEN